MTRLSFDWRVSSSQCTRPMHSSFLAEPVDYGLGRPHLTTLMLTWIDVASGGPCDGSHDHPIG